MEQSDAETLHQTVDELELGDMKKKMSDKIFSKVTIIVNRYFMIIRKEMFAKLVFLSYQK